MMDAEELKQLAVGVITSAVNARPLPVDGRIDQYGKDFIMLTQGMTVGDLYRLCSLLADIGGSFVEMLSDFSEVDTNEMMQFLAKQVLSTPTQENDL